MILAVVFELAEYRTGNAEQMGSNLVETMNLFQVSLQLHFIYDSFNAYTSLAVMQSKMILQTNKK